jgi:hypothetical protein
MTTQTYGKDVRVTPDGRPAQEPYLETQGELQDPMSLQSETTRPQDLTR